MRNPFKTMVLSALVLSAACAAFAQGANPASGKRGMGPKTSYEKSRESVTSSDNQGSAGICIGQSESKDGKELAASVERNEQRAYELHEDIQALQNMHEERLRHLSDLDRQIAEASATEQAIAQGQPGSPQIAQARAIMERLKKQRADLAEHDRSQEEVRKKLAQEEAFCTKGAQALSKQVLEVRKTRVEGMRGTVEVQRADGTGWEPTAENSILRKGDTIRTGPDGHVTLQLDDGTSIRLNPSSTFVLSSKDGVLGEQSLGDIFYWIRKKLKRAERWEMIHTPPAVCAVRGTEFGLSVKPGEPTRLTAVQGVVGLTAQPEKIQKDKISAWWTKSQSPGSEEPLPAEALARIGSGTMQVKRKGKAWEPARPGDTLHEGDLVKTGSEGPAWVELAGGYAVALAQNSVLELRNEPKQGILYGLWKGRLYAKRRGEAAADERPAKFISPSAVCAVRGTTFEYAVPRQQAPEFMVYDGEIEVTADAKRLQDPELFKPWWED